MILKSWSRLIDILDVKFGLLDELLSFSCINERHLQIIESKKTDSTHTEKLLTILLRKSVVDFYTFIQCLIKTKRNQAAFLLDTKLTYWRHSTVKSDVYKSRIKMNYVALVECIDARSGLLDKMYSDDCFTWRQRNTYTKPIYGQCATLDYQQYSEKEVIPYFKSSYVFFVKLDNNTCVEC